MELYSVDELIRKIKSAYIPCIDSRIELNLRFKYYNNEYGNIRSFLELKVGEKNYQSVKNMKAFLNSLEYQQAYEFSKGFSYNPSIHSFSEKDTEALEILKEINSAEDKNIYKFSSYGGSSTLIAGRRIALPDKQFIRFLKLINGCTIEAVIKGQEYSDVSILVKELPLSFKLCFDEAGIQLGYEKDIPIVLDREFNIFWFNKSIYLPPQEQLRIYKPLFNLMSKENNTMLFNRTDNEKVMSNLIPTLRKIAESIKLFKGTTIIEESDRELGKLFEKR
jgi:hypothetical protein